MIEKDYISRVIQQLTLAMSNLLRLKKDDNRPEMEVVVYDALKQAGIDPDAPDIGNIQDDRVLVPLSEAISVYLSAGEDERLSRINDLIAERLKEQKSFILKL